MRNHPSDAVDNLTYDVAATGRAIALEDCIKYIT